MRAVLGIGPDSRVEELRQIVLGGGLDCEADDCVLWSDLATRLGRGDADLLIVDGTREDAWKAVEEAGPLTEAALLVIAAPDQAHVVKQARRLGVAGLIDPQRVRESLDAALEDLFLRGNVRGRRGRVISVFAPVPGSGATTVAANLGGAMLRRYPDQVALIELAREFGDVSLLLDLEPKATAEEVCRRWDSLDRSGLFGCLTVHSSGLRVLANAVDAVQNRYLTTEAVRRLAILARVAIRYTVLALDNRLSEVEVEAMRLSDAIVVVIRPDVPGVRRARWALAEAVTQGVPRNRFRVVVNRYGQSGQLPLAQIESALGFKARHLIPDDPGSVNRAANEGQLLRAGLWQRRIHRRFAALAGVLNGRNA